jgi:hypothetical protein
VQWLEMLMVWWGGYIEEATTGNISLSGNVTAFICAVGVDKNPRSE